MLMIYKKRYIELHDKIFHFLPLQLSCCGIHSYTDWFETPYGIAISQVPASCCKNPLNHSCIRTYLKQNLPTDINENVRILLLILSFGIKRKWFILHKEFSLQGCYETVIAAIKNNYPIVGGIILVIALFPLIGIILVCCLAGQMKKHRYERVD